MRLIDNIISFIQGNSSIPPVHRQVMIDRLEKPPTDEELDVAREKLNRPSESPWDK